MKFLIVLIIIVGLLLTGFHLILLQINPEKIVPMWVAFGLNALVLGPFFLLYLFFQWKQERDQAVQVFYSGYLIRFVFFFIAIKVIEELEVIEIKALMPFAIFFYIVLLFTEAILICYQLNQDE